jgi:hypothetical protein
MKYLTLVFWAIVVELSLRIILYWHPKSIEHVLRHWERIKLTLYIIIGLLHLFCPSAIGYILRLFGEKSWIVWCSYFYVLSWVLITIAPFTWLRPDGLGYAARYAVGVTVAQFPVLLSCLAWWRVKTPLIAPLYQLLATSFACGIIVEGFLEWSYVLHYTQWTVYAMDAIGILVQFPLLFLIARTQQWIADNRLLENEIKQIG